MRKFKTDERLKRITEAVISRQHSLRFVLENVHDPHNVSAIFRTCDAVGIPKISLLYTIEQFPKISKVSSASANKWIEIEKFNNTKKCVEKLKNDGFLIYSSKLDINAINLYKLDLTKKIAFVVGNENRGISEEINELSDKTFYIPMRGMVQSLNVSVASAVILYETQRQREKKGMYKKSDLPKNEVENLIDKWCEK